VYRSARDKKHYSQNRPHSRKPSEKGKTRDERRRWLEAKSGAAEIEPDKAKYQATLERRAGGQAFRPKERKKKVQKKKREIKQKQPSAFGGAKRKTQNRAQQTNCHVNERKSAELQSKERRSRDQGKNGK